jgi:hypothetical protein
MNRKHFILYSIIILLFVAGIFNEYFSKKRKDKLFSEATKLIEVVLYEVNIQYSGGFTIWFKYTVNNKEYEQQWARGAYTFLEKGDTILIEYSVEDPIVIEVVDPCYMQKHNGKPYCK